MGREEEERSKEEGRRIGERVVALEAMGREEEGREGGRQVWRIDQAVFQVF